MKSVSDHLPQAGRNIPKSAPKEAEQSGNRMTCEAHGCNRVGSISETAGPDAKFVCWAHYEVKDKRDWDRMTKAIHENEWLMDLNARMVTKSLFDIECRTDTHLPEQEIIERYLRQKGLDELCRKVNTVDGRQVKEPLQAWQRRIRSHVLWVLNGSKEKEKPGTRRFEMPNFRPMP